jgi:hypothetical protein
VPSITLPATGVAAEPVCPGPETLTVPDGGSAVKPAGPVVVGAAVVAAGAASSSSPVAAGAKSGTATGTTAKGARRDVANLAGTALPAAAPGLALLTVARATGGPVLLHTPPGASVPAVSSVQLSLGRSGDLRGLAGVACPTASTRSWLVGGGTQAGRRGRLLLANPAATTATVDVTVIGPKGPVPAPGGTGLVIASGAQKALLVDALAPDLTAVAVQVQARTGRVVATLHDTWVRGLTPGGVDDVTPSATASQQQVVPGMSIAPASGMSLPSDPQAPGAVAVRVVVPGSSPAVVRVRLLGPGGEVDLPDSGVVTVPAGTVQDVPITGVAAGTYTAVVDADVPILASGLLGRTEPGGQAAGTPAGVAAAVPPSELAWAPSVAPLAGRTVVAVPAVPDTETSGHSVPVSATLSAAAVGKDASVLVTELGADGDTLASSTLRIDAGTAVAHVVAAGTEAVILAPSSAPVSASLVLQAKDTAGPMITVVPVRSGPTGTGQRPVVVADPRVGLDG